MSIKNKTKNSTKDHKKNFLQNYKMRYLTFSDTIVDIKDSINKHLLIVKYALTQEKTRPKDGLSKMNTHEQDFLPAVLEVTEKPPSPAGRFFAYSICAIFTITILWASIGEVDIIATSTGKIVPNSRAKIIQPLEKGIVKAIYVEDGQMVKKGDLLIELNPTEASADIERVKIEYKTALLEAQRFKALLEKKPLANFTTPKDINKELVSRHRQFLIQEINERLSRQRVVKDDIKKQQAQIDVINAEIKKWSRIIPSVKERVEKHRGLVKKGIIAKLPFLEMEQELIEKEEQKKVEEKRLSEAKALLKSLQSKLRQLNAEFNKATIEKLAQTEEEIAALEQERIKAHERQRRLKLTAPENGFIQQLSVHTVGGVVTEAQQLMVLVPTDEDLEVEALVENKDIGFVLDNQFAEIKVEAFPFTKYGTIPAKVLHVSLDSVQDKQKGLVFPARISMTKSKIKVEGKWINLTPGMAVTVEIKTGRRKIIEFLLSPLVRYADESIRER